MYHTKSYKHLKEVLAMWRPRFVALVGSWSSTWRHYPGYAANIDYPGYVKWRYRLSSHHDLLMARRQNEQSKARQAGRLFIQFASLYSRASCSPKSCESGNIGSPNETLFVNA